MENYQERVVGEKGDIDRKAERLEAFLRSDKSNHITEDERDRMARQNTAMREYSRILGERIAAF